MSIAYQLDLGASVAPDEVVLIIVNTADGEVDEHEAASGSLRSGVWFTVDFAEYAPPDPVELQFGFIPRTEVSFGFDKFGDFEARETELIRLVLGVLAGVPGDALFHYQHDDVWLLRRDGSVTVNGDLWKPQQIALISAPYGHASLRFE